MKHLRILHTVEFYEPSKGGAQEVVRQLSERLVARGHDVTVATTALPQRGFKELNGVKIAGFQVQGNLVRGLQGDVEGYRRFVAEGRFDVVMNYAAQQWATDALLEVLPRLPAAKVFVPCGFSGLGQAAYDDYFRRMPAWLGQYGACVYLSKDYRDAAFARAHGLGNGHLIPNGASAAEFEAPVSLDVRAQLGLRPDEFFVLHIGTHSGYKGHPEAAAVLEASGITDAALVVVGDGMRGPCGRACAWRSVSTRLKPSWRKRRLRFLSVQLPRPAVVAALKQADLFLFPSNIEASPLVLFEASAAKLPYLCSEVGNSREIIEWTGGGELIRTTKDAQGYSHIDIADGAERLRALWQAPERRQALGQAGHRAWAERFTWEKIALEYERLYQGLLA